MNTSERGMDVLMHNPYISQKIAYKSNSLPEEELEGYWSGLAEKHGASRTINLCESIEVELALHPKDPRYAYTKPERRALCDKNYYKHTFTFAGVKPPADWADEDFRPQFFSTRAERRRVQRGIDKFRGYGFAVMFSMSGSGGNKRYPYISSIMGNMLDRWPGCKIITVGDYMSKLAECDGIFDMSRYMATSGMWSIRESFTGAGMVDALISTDTGLLHAGGCYDTPKLGLLGHSTIRNVTETFANDYSLEAKWACAPCFRMIYDKWLQCPVDEGKTNVTHCMSFGLPVERVMAQVGKMITENVPEHRREGRARTSVSMSKLQV